MSNYYFPNSFLTELNEQVIVSKINNYPKISIVMPTYNQAQFIEKSILSILNQDYPNFELIIIDGGSNDGTVDKIKKFGDNITFWISEKDQGQSDALNKGFKYCSGEIYGWLNSDDIYLPNTFKKAISIFEKNKDKKIVFGDWLSIDIQDSIIEHFHAFDFNLNHFKYEGFHLNAQSMFWHKSVHNHFSGFQVNLHNTMDYQMILEFGINEGEKSFVRTPEIFGAFRRYKGQKSAGMIPNVISEQRIISEKYHYLDKYKSIGKLKRIYFRLRRAFWYYKRGSIVNLINRLKKAYINKK
tara:strand:+ start:963 stop:1856 length:894 start_codon:yes stop_codon:yes gene_type:complete